MVQQKSVSERPQGQSKAGSPSIAGGRGLSLFEDSDRWFEDFFSRRFWPGLSEPSLRERWAQRHALAPKVDVVDQDKQIVFRAEVPGVERDNLDVSVTDNMVTIRGHSRTETSSEEGDYFRREISQGAFERTIPLPCDVDADKARATFRDGILELTLPKLKEVRRRRISVE